MKILIIPEDPRKDQYILKPIFERLFTSFEKPNTKVIVCTNPSMRGVNDALNPERLLEVFERYPMMDIFVLCVDRDGDLNRRAKLDHLEKTMTTRGKLVAVNAWEELETWVLAGLDLPKDWVWGNVRSDISVKENYFEPLASQRGVSDGPGGGRKSLGEEAARHLRGMRQKCPEDLDHVAKRLEQLAT